MLVPRGHRPIAAWILPWIALLAVGGEASSAASCEPQPDAHGEVVAFLQTSQEVKETPASPWSKRPEPVGLTQKATNTAATLLGQSGARHATGRRGGAMSAAVVLAVLLVGVPMLLVAALLLYDNLFKPDMMGDYGLMKSGNSPPPTLAPGSPPADWNSQRPRPSPMPYESRSPCAGSASADWNSQRLNSAPHMQNPSRSPDGSLQHVAPGAAASVQNSLTPSSVRISRQASLAGVFEGPDKAHMPFPPIMPPLILPSTEAHFMVSYEQLVQIRDAPVDIRGTSGKALMQTRFMEENGGRTLELTPVAMQSSVAFLVINQPGSRSLEIHGKKELYGTVSMVDDSHAMLHYKGQPAMAFALGDHQKFEIASTLLDGTSLGFCTLVEVSGRKILRTQVMAGADWVCIMAVFLGLVAMPL